MILERRAKLLRARRGVERGRYERQASDARKERAVREYHAHFEFAARLEERSRAGVGFPVEHLLGRRAEHDICRVEVVDRGEQVGGAGDASAHFEAGAPDASGHLGADDRIVEVLPGLVERGFRGIELSARVIDVLLRDGVPGEERLEAADRALCVVVAGEDARVCGFGLDAIEAEKHLAGGDRGAFDERPLEDHALDASAHVGASRRLDLPDEIVRLRQCLRCDGDDADVGRRERARLRGSATARGAEQERSGGDARGRPPRANETVRDHPSPVDYWWLPRRSERNGQPNKRRRTVNQRSGDVMNL